MSLINYFSNAVMPCIIVFVVFIGFKEKIKVFDTFEDGVKEAIKIVFNMIPTLMGIFIAIGMLRSSGIIEFLIVFLKPLIKIINIPLEIMPLVILKPISRKCLSCNGYRSYEGIWR